MLGLSRVAPRAIFPLAAAVSVVSPADAATPLQIWQDVSRIGVQCVVRASAAAARSAVQSLLCARVRALAAAGAPAPVVAIDIGDPAILAQGTVTLLVHASAEPVPDGLLVAFTIRPFRAEVDQASVLYGAAPRAAAIANSGAANPALDAALEAALSETLPWLGAPHVRRPGMADS